jgi:peroxiredoxin
VSDPDLELAEAYEVVYQGAKLFPRVRRSCFLVDTDEVIQYRWLADHWLDPTRDVPPVEEIHEAVWEPPGEPTEVADEGRTALGRFRHRI